jgi:hypothetical protein
MMLGHTKLLALGCVVLCACSSASMPSVNEFASEDIARKGEGAAVVINGYLKYDSHARQLWSSRSAMRQDLTSRCVTLVNTATNHDILKKMSGKYIQVVGKLKQDVLAGHVDLGACNKVGIEVDSVSLVKSR